MLGVINDILDMSKIEAGRFSLDPEPIDLCPLITEAVRVVAVSAEAKNIEVTTKIEPRIAVNADRRAIKQIFAQPPFKCSEIYRGKRADQREGRAGLVVL